MKKLNILLTLSILTLAFTISQEIFNPDTETYLKNKLKDSVVYVVNENENGGGTGFLLKNEEGREYIVTNNHVCSHTQVDGMVKVKTDEKVIKRKVIDMSQDADLCIIEAGFDQEPLKMAKKYTVGNKAYVMGHPYLNPLTFVSGDIVAKQKISIVKYEMTEDSPPCDGNNQHPATLSMFIFAVNVCLQDYDSLSTTISTYPGNSGSPMVDDKGDVIGVIFAGNNYTNWGHAVPLEDLKAFINKY